MAGQPQKVYRWATPHDWLNDASKEWDAERLASELFALAARLDSDELQDEYQAEMDADGYFAPEGGAVDLSEPCRVCGTKDNPAGGDGWDGMCSNCADKADADGQS